MKTVIILKHSVLVTWTCWLVVTFMLVSSVKSDSQEILNGLDYRTVNYKDLLPSLEQFFDDGVEHFDELLFDSPHHQLIVGARDALYRLSLEGLTKLEKAEWPAKQDKISLCITKGQSEKDCRNFVKVLVSHQDQLLACGTYSFSPKCSWRPIEAIRQVTEYVDGRGKCPYNPRANASAYMNSQGDYYIASSTDFSANDHAIYKMSGWPKLQQNLMRTIQYNTEWLSQTNFVLTFETEQFVYFVFRENAIEFSNCGKRIYSRIARVCKNDQGGQRVLKDNWTTFLKARLNCSLAADHPFYYDEIQSAYYMKSEGLVYATFTTPENSIAGSAICSFNISEVDQTFRGPFKKRAGPDSIWKTVREDVDHSHFECDKSGDNDYRIPTSREYQLMDRAVPSTLNRPIYKENLERFTHILVDSAFTKHQDSIPIHVLFVATRTGIIKKLSYNPRSRVTCLVEILHPFAEGRPVLIHNMKLLAYTNAIYMATQENVIRLPVQRCQRFQTQRECLNAMDPYCGWNKQTNLCSPTPNNNPRAAYWVQNGLSCPIMSDPVDGGWGSMSEWFQCDYANPDRNIDSNGDYCQCRQRLCNKPSPVNGGLECEGRSLEVTNCTQHGGWTSWSDWSSCSQTCDIGMKSRKRTCGNPSPSFGGRVCVGRDTDSQYCNNLPPCSTAVSIVSQSAARVDQPKGLWGQWAAWSDCSAECGRGFRTRTRRCYSSQGLCEGGCATQFEECENKKCSDLVEVTDWTPWLKSNETTIGGSWHEQRFRFSYKAPVALSQIGQVHMEERYCRGINSCASTKMERSQMDTWSEWSQCTRECSGGYQVKIRSCSQSSSCIGSSVVQRACNTQPCSGEWACWSDWSNCDGRSLKKHRTRHCKSVNGVLSGDRTSPLCSSGTSYEEMPCDGWDNWTPWSQCDLATDSRTRTRVCLTTSGCDQGHNLERQSCDGLPKPVSSSSDLLAVACICSFVVGCGVGAGVVIYFLKFKRPGGNGSPHYVSAKSQNLYVSLPMLDLKHKHLSSNQSDCGTLRSTASTLRSKTGSSVYNAGGRGGAPSDYETATIKRSHSQRNSSLIAGSSTMMRADLDSDQLFT